MAQTRNRRPSNALKEMLGASPEHEARLQPFATFW
jgi:hypothetical protein